MREPELASINMLSNPQLGDLNETIKLKFVCQLAASTCQICQNKHPFRPLLLGNFHHKYALSNKMQCDLFARILANSLSLLNSCKEDGVPAGSAPAVVGGPVSWFCLCFGWSAPAPTSSRSRN
eukprot:TRINITY_DN8343_c0_g1_i1.p2 TRINITY_DN8343_c0_g1~~TRINITY_DN8343_c0_g1_i1.p2  ORF type:complete len:123 (-),score=19.23 TRINITY_DN8343_c0_g1_i1:251-619(-)